MTPTTESGGGGLPVTGAQSLVLVAVTAVLLAVGAGFGIVSRRKRLEGEELTPPTPRAGGGGGPAPGAGGGGPGGNPGGGWGGGGEGGKLIGPVQARS